MSASLTIIYSYNNAYTCMSVWLQVQCLIRTTPPNARDCIPYSIIHNIGFMMVTQFSQNHVLVQRLSGTILHTCSYLCIGTCTNRADYTSYAVHYSSYIRFLFSQLVKIFFIFIKDGCLPGILR